MYQIEIINQNLEITAIDIPARTVEDAITFINRLCKAMGMIFKPDSSIFGGYYNSSDNSFSIVLV